MKKQNYAGFFTAALTLCVGKWRIALGKITVNWWRHSRPWILSMAHSWMSARWNLYLTSPRHLLWTLSLRWPATSSGHRWKSPLHRMGKSGQWNRWLRLVHHCLYCTLKSYKAPLFILYCHGMVIWWPLKTNWYFSASGRHQAVKHITHHTYSNMIWFNEMTIYLIVQTTVILLQSVTIVQHDVAFILLSRESLWL